MVTGVEQSWSRSGFLEPLEKRWAEACARLLKLSPASGSLCGQPRSEIALDSILDEIARRTRPPVDDPALRAASEELTNLERRYHASWLSIRELQKQLRNAEGHPVHKILRDIPAGAFADAGPPEYGRPDYTTARQGRQVVQAFLPYVLRLEALESQLSAAANVDNDAEGLDRKLIYALAERIEALEQKVAQLSQAPAVQNGSVRKRVKELANAGHSTREIAAIVGCSKSTVANYLAEKER